MSIRSVLLVPGALLTLAVTAAACGAGSPSEPAPSGPSTSGGHDMDASYMFGRPGTGEDIDRVIEITQSDDMRFTPGSLEIEAGETVRFDVTNAGQAVHEFVLGDMATQHEHEEEMGEMGGMMASGEPYAISVDPGESASISWTFTAPGDFLYGCHVPGHYDAGMVADITVG